MSKKQVANRRRRLQLDNSNKVKFIIHNLLAKLNVKYKKMPFSFKPLC